MNTRIQRSARRAMSLVLLAASLSLAPSCAMVGRHTAEDVSSVPVSTDYPKRTYEATLEEVQGAARNALATAQIETVEEGSTDDGIWFIVGEVSYSWRSNGQFLRIAAKPLEDEDVSMTGVFYNSVKRIDMNVTEDLIAVRNNVLSAMDTYIDSLPAVDR